MRTASTLASDFTPWCHFWFCLRIGTPNFCFLNWAVNCWLHSLFLLTLSKLSARIYFFFFRWFCGWLALLILFLSISWPASPSEFQLLEEVIVSWELILQQGKIRMILLERSKTTVRSHQFQLFITEHFLSQYVFRATCLKFAWRDFCNFPL